MNSSMTIERTQAIARKHTRSRGKLLTLIMSIMCMICMTMVEVYADGDGNGGVYEIVMSFMQNQPEAKTKGIIMAISGAVMIGLKPIVEAATGESF